MPETPLERLSTDQVMVLTMMRLVPHMILCYCLTGDHFGVSPFREPRCPLCG